MTFKDALNNFKDLFDQKLYTSSTRLILKIQRDWIRINSNLHLYYVAYDVGDTDVANDCINDILDILLSYGYTADPPSPISGGGDGVVPTDNFLDWDGLNLYYKPYTSKQSFLSLDTGNVDPSGTGRLNINGVVHATKFSADNVDIRSGGALALRKQVVGAITDGDVQLRADANGYYIERRESGAWVIKGDITF